MCLVTDSLVKLKMFHFCRIVVAVVLQVAIQRTKITATRIFKTIDSTDFFSLDLDASTFDLQEKKLFRKRKT